MHWVPNLQLVRGPVTTFNAYIYCHFEKMKKKIHVIINELFLDFQVYYFT